MKKGLLVHRLLELLLLEELEYKKHQFSAQRRHFSFSFFLKYLSP